MDLLEIDIDIYNLSFFKIFHDNISNIGFVTYQEINNADMPYYYRFDISIFFNEKYESIVQID